VRQSFLKVNGLNIRYLEAGNNVLQNGKGANTIQHHVLFIHGLGSSADRWLDIPDALSITGLHTIAMDLPGFGLSDKPGDMDACSTEVETLTAYSLQHSIGPS
jgi:pimeloyl-ACP methyl ester carboxylesterase